MNGDDGYTNGGGGGSVLWEFHVSEVNADLSLTERIHPPDHRPRKAGYKALHASGVDTYTEHKKGDKVGTNGATTGEVTLTGEEEFVKGQGSGYFVMVIDDARDIKRIEIDPPGPGGAQRVRIYVPVAKSKGRQVSLRWGLRRAVGEAVQWGSLLKGLLSGGAVQIDRTAPTVEGPLEGDNAATV
jgi:hypothetical protein